MNALALSLILAVDYSPKIQIPVTQWLAQSVSQYIALTAQNCKKLSIPADKCGNEAEKEILKTREYVDKVCEKIAPPKDQVQCIQEWMEEMIDNVLIPGKLKLLSTKMI